MDSVLCLVGCRRSRAGLLHAAPARLQIHIASTPRRARLGSSQSTTVGATYHHSINLKVFALSRGGPSSRLWRCQKTSWYAICVVRLYICHQRACRDNPVTPVRTVSEAPATRCSPRGAALHEQTRRGSRAQQMLHFCPLAMYCRRSFIITKVPRDSLHFRPRLAHAARDLMLAAHLRTHDS